MAGYLKEPVVLQWNMKTGSYGKIVQHIIEKKVCELDPIKIRYINPKDVDDFSTCKFCSNGTPILKLAVHPF